MLKLISYQVPDNFPLDGAATIPDNFITAYWTIFGTLKLPVPDTFPASSPPPLADTPILIYGAGSSSAQYIIQLLKLAGYKQILAAASPRHHTYLRTLGATHTFDYASVDFPAQVLKAAGGPVKIAVDPIASKTSLAALTELIGHGSKLAILLPVKDGDGIVGHPGSKMTLGIPEAVEAMFEGVELLGVRTFLWQSVSHSSCAGKHGINVTNLFRIRTSRML